MNDHDDRETAPRWVRRTLLLCALVAPAMSGCDTVTHIFTAPPTVAVESTMPQRLDALLDDRRRALERGTLHLGLEALTDAELAALLDDPRVPALSVLYLSDNKLTDAAVELILESPKTQALRELVLDEPGIGDAGVTRLLSSARLSTLRALSLALTRATPAAYAALDPDRLPTLTTLSLTGTTLDGRIVDPLLALPAIESLQLTRTGLDAHAVRRLLAETRAHALGLSGNELGSGSLAALPAFSASLRDVDLSGNGLGSADIMQLSRLSAAPTALDLGHVGAEGEALRTLAKAPWLSEMRALVLISRHGSADAKDTLRQAWGERPGLTL